MNPLLVIGTVVGLFLAVVWSFKNTYRSTWNVPAYDPKEAQSLAAQLQRCAAAAPIYHAWYGAALGALAGGYFAPGRLVVFSIVGGLVGGSAGYSLGRLREISLRAKAQALLCQMKIEENTRGGARPGRVES